MKNHVFAISLISIVCLIGASFATFGCEKPKVPNQEIPAANSTTDATTMDATPIPVVTPPTAITPEVETSLDATPVVVPTVPVVTPVP